MGSWRPVLSALSSGFGWHTANIVISTAANATAVETGSLALLDQIVAIRASTLEWSELEERLFRCPDQPFVESGLRL